MVIKRVCHPIDRDYDLVECRLIELIRFEEYTSTRFIECFVPLLSPFATCK